MDPDYGARYATLYRQHWWWRAREELLHRELKRAIGPGGAGEVLDFGCGDGLFFPVLERFGTTRGIEPDAALLDPAGPWRARISTDALGFDLRETGRYGLIVALDVLEHIADPVPIMHELARRLRPGGWFMATVPAFRELWTTHDDINHHFRRYRAGELAALMRDEGLEVVTSRYFFVWLAVAKALVVAAERVLRPQPRPAKLPPRILNAAALSLSRLEQRTLGRTHPWWGSSALVLARKPV